MSLINPFEYVKSIQGQWAWKDNAAKAYWQKDHLKRWVMIFELHTGGLSDHEQIMEEIEKSQFWFFCWAKSERGGHYLFEVDPYMFGYRLVNDYAREKGISRQYIYHNPDKFEWINVSKGVKFIKPTPSKNTSNT